MRRPPSSSLRWSTLLVVASLVAAGCGGGGDPAARPTTTAPPTTAATSTTTDAALAPLLLRAADLPGDFQAAAAVDDTITAFCASEDAAAGLHATARAVQGFTRTGGGASVIQLAFRFTGDGAAQLVRQAGGVLERCSGVPDIKGLAFDYDPLAAELDAILAGIDGTSVGRHGVNVGSGSLSIDVAVLQHGDVGQLVAVLGLDLPRAELDAIAAAAFAAVVART